MIFKKEAKFEDALIKVLFNKGWSSEVIMYPTEEDLIQNWANILFNNRSSEWLSADKRRNAADNGANKNFAYSTYAQ